MSNNNGANAAGLGLVFVGVVFVATWLAMLVFGAFLGSVDAWTPGYWQTFFGLWSVAILGGAWHNGIAGLRK